MKNVIEAVQEQKHISEKLSYAVGYLKGYKESVIGRKEFTVEEVIELLEAIRAREN